MRFTIQIEANSLSEALEKLHQDYPDTVSQRPMLHAVPDLITQSDVPVAVNALPAPVAPVPVAPVQQPAATVPTATKTYSEEELMRAAAALMDAGRMGDIQQVLAGMGVQTFTQLPVERYGEFAMALKTLGAKL